MQVKKQQLELNMELLTGSELRKEYVKDVYRHPAYLTYMQSISCEMPGWMKLKLESMRISTLLKLIENTFQINGNENMLPVDILL